MRWFPELCSLQPWPQPTVIAFSAFLPRSRHALSCLPHARASDNLIAADFDKLLSFLPVQIYDIPLCSYFDLQARPSHTLIAADFDELPEVAVAGINAPLVATTVSHCWLVDC